MKKPNITEGEWIREINMIFVKIDGVKYWVCECYNEDYAKQIEQALKKAGCVE